MDIHAQGTLRQKLLARRRALLGLRERNLAAEHELRAQLAPDWEDAAADVSAASVLGSLGERERLDLARIDAALRRMAGGSYGTCRSCGGDIAPARLAAIPEAERCTECASGAEQARHA